MEVFGRGNGILEVVAFELTTTRSGMIEIF
jgi:hypothetical protein